MRLFFAVVFLFCISLGANATGLANVSVSNAVLELDNTGYALGSSVNMISATAADVFWLSENEYVGEVIYQNSSGSLQHATEGSAKRKHQVRLTDLVSGDTTYYRIHGDDKVSKVLSFKAPPTSGGVTFLQYSDAQNASAFAITAANFNSVQKDFYLSTGDNTEDALGELGIEIISFSSLLPVASGKPFYCTVGNHDDGILGADSYALWKSYFSIHQGGDSRSYYSFDWGDAHFMLLNSQADSPTQLEWLEADLAATQKPWKILVHHKPPYTTYHSSYNNQYVRTNIVPLMEEYGVQLMISGHTHLYEHMVKDNIHYVTGLASGDGVLAQGGTYRSGNNVELPEGVIRLGYVENLNGYSTFSISGNTLTATVYKSSDNSVVDTWTITK